MKLISKLRHLTYEFVDSQSYLVCCSANSLYIYLKNNLKEPLAKVKCKHISRVAISNQEKLIYILDTSGNFYLYDIENKSFDKIPNKLKCESFSSMKVLPDDSCLWCAGNNLFKYSRENQKIELLLEVTFLLDSIVKIDSDSLYISASDDFNYIVHFYFDGRVYYKKIKTYKSFGISKILHHKPSDTFVIVKGKKLFVPKGDINFDDNSDIKLKKTDYKLKKGDIEDVKFSNDGELIAIITRKFIFSKTIRIFNVKSRDLIFETDTDGKMKYRLGQFKFSYDDKFIYISLDNWEYGGFCNVYDLEKQ